MEVKLVGTTQNGQSAIRPGDVFVSRTGAIYVLAQDIHSSKYRARTLTTNDVWKTYDSLQEATSALQVNIAANRLTHYPASEYRINVSLVKTT